MYRKLTADQIFTGYEILQAPAVLVVEENGVVVDLVDSADAGSDIEYFNGILSPGFINCHCHLELSHMKGIVPKNTGLVDFVLKIMGERTADEKIISEAIGRAENEMLQNGIVAVGDICNTAHTISQKKESQLAYHNFIEVSGFVPASAGNRFLPMRELYDEFAKNFPRNSIVPHAPYSVSKELLEMIIDYPGNDLQSMHNQEAMAENELFTSKQGALLDLYQSLGISIDFFDPPGKSSLQFFLPRFKSYRPLILVHDLFTSEEDILFANTLFNTQPSNLYFCLCPNANLYIGNKLPDVQMFRKHQCNIVLGTDSLASNDQLSIMGEIQTLRKNFPELQLNELLQWATINGAHALNISDVYGSFGKGKKPGVLQILDSSINRIF